MTPQSKPPKGRPPQGRPQKSRALTRPPRKITATHLTWGSTIVVLIVVLSLVLAYNLAGPQKNAFGVVGQPVFSQVTSVPASVFDEVGIHSPNIKLYDFFTKKGQPALTTDVGGHPMPLVFYWGAEYCPYCAAFRWGLIAALSRFGTFDRLYYMKSSSTDVNPDTPTFSFYKTTYTSPYFVFKGYEIEDRNKHPLMNAPANITSTVAHYNPHGYFPFMDVGNKTFVVGSVFDPGTLAGATQAQIAAALNDPSQEITQAIIAEANYVSAAICEAVPNATPSVCTSSGVKTAMQALKKLPPLP